MSRRNEVAASATPCNPFGTLTCPLCPKISFVFWHRNPQNQNTGYCINGFINHYPDFILKTKSGKYLIVEPKGDHLDNDDSKNKRLLGKELVSEANKMAGETKYYYFMVFENKNVDGAFSLEECMSIVKKL